MAAAATVPQQPAPGASQSPQTQAAMIPFIVGSNKYREAPFFTQAFTPGASSTARVFQVTPGNFLGGITLQITGTGGTLGTVASITTNSTTAAGNGALDLLGGITLTDTGGAPIIYPISLFTAAMVQKYFLPWLGDPQTRANYSNTINPVVTVNLRVEVRDTLGVLANTDARAQYRLAYTENPLVAATNAPGLVTASTGVTAPTVTVKGYIDAWAQPDQVDLLGNPIQQTPDGLLCSRFIMREQPTLNSGNNVLRFTLTGNEIRCLMLIFRDSNGKRIDLSDAGAGNLRLRLDNRVLWTMTPTQIVEEMTKFYGWTLQNGSVSNAPVRETGLYVIPRFRNPGDLIGEYWQQTVEQSLLQLEVTASATDFSTNLPGTVEIVYDQLAIAPGVVLPAEFEGI